MSMSSNNTDTLKTEAGSSSETKEAACSRIWCNIPEDT